MTKTTANLNLRAGAGTSEPSIFVIPKGAIVNVTGDPWYPVDYGEYEGWSSGKYLDGLPGAASEECPECVECEPCPQCPPAIDIERYMAWQGRFLSTAFKHLGKDYKWGANGPDNFDCSGYTRTVLHDVGFTTITAKISANTQMEKFRDGSWVGTKITNPADFRAGDVAFFGSGDHATHITFMLSPDYLIGANGGYEATKTHADAVRVGACVRIDRIDYREKKQGKDRIEAWRPAYDWS